MIFETIKLRGIRKIGNIKSSNSYVSDRKRFYEWEITKKFPSKNNVKLTSFLIKKFSEEKDHVCDPMCGIGTSIVEAIKLKRCAIGLDVSQKSIEIAHANAQKTQNLLGNDSGFFKIYWMPAQMAKDILPCGFFQLVLFSPPYGRQNHSAGKKPKQKKIIQSKHLYSCQKYFNSPDDYSDFDVTKGKGLTGFYERMRTIIDSVSSLLKKNGYLVLILQDYVRKGKIVGLVQAFVDMVNETYLMIPYGYFERKLPMTAFKNWGKDKRNFVGVEHILVFKKGMK